MPRNIFTLIVSMLLIVSITGCGMKARVFKQRKERVDQAMAGQEPLVKKTREVLVLEVVKEDQKGQEKTTALSKGDSSKTSAETKPEISSPSGDNQLGSSQDVANPSRNNKGIFAVISPLEYTVQKDDTLQTIAKKFYNSYSKWPLIYEANKDKISDPNRIKTGIVIIIPKLED